MLGGEFSEAGGFRWRIRQRNGVRLDDIDYEARPLGAHEEKVRVHRTHLAPQIKWNAERPGLAVRVSEPSYDLLVLQLALENFGFGAVEVSVIFGVVVNVHVPLPGLLALAYVYDTGVIDRI